MQRLLYLFSLAIATPLSAMPAGFELTVVTNDVPNARQIAESPNGTLYVGTRREGKVYAVVPASTPGIAPEVVTVATGLTMPSGLVLVGDDLYVGALNQILRYRNIDATFRDPPQPVVVTDLLPGKTHHGWKYLSLGPDGYLYVPVGAPCNVCLEDDERFASILRMHPETGATTLYARGIRNSVGLAWHPETRQLWFSDNGRDMLGDDVPAEEINRVTKPGDHFGFPYIHEGVLPDPDFGAGHDPANYEPPVVKIQAHSAALGIDFYDHDVFPKPYRGALFIAEHGSWNRSSKVGYRVSVIRFTGSGPVYEPFVDIWLKGQQASGRPNDVLVARDGSLLITDDQAGAIYRVTYSADR